ELISQQWVEEAAALLQDGKLVKVPNEAHAVNFTAPWLLANIIAEFIKNKRVLNPALLYGKDV
ncbi:MAG: hypothetical protein ACOC0R_05980, partial [Mariniphaga sp.]